jgi:hypothetical protein
MTQHWGRPWMQIAPRIARKCASVIESLESVSRDVDEIDALVSGLARRRCPRRAYAGDLTLPSDCGELIAPERIGDSPDDGNAPGAITGGVLSASRVL